MEVRYSIQNHLVTVNIQEGLVRLVSDEALKQVIRNQPTDSVLFLINQIKTDYAVRYGKQLAIGDHSFATEIRGHIYFELFLLRHRRILQVVLFFGLYTRFCRSCAVIDCGEKGKDPNRLFWDVLSVFTRNAMK